MARLASIGRLIAVLSLQSRASQSHRIDWTLVLAFACTALTFAAAVGLLYFHYLDRP
ncbi:hypothetical protein ACFFWD_04075 [Bradyrhizobium erythrophlei]|uniref:hypothetical protein n=1 Tax=Bradyrhizobium erythrophlei TaxID=1437360 RepID=UPI0035EF00C3